MKTCPRCEQISQDAFSKCIGCGGDISAVPSDGKAAPMPDTREILNKSRFSEEDGRAQFIGIAGAILGGVYCLSLFLRSGAIEGVYSGLPAIVIGYFAGKKLAKKFLD